MPAPRSSITDRDPGPELSAVVDRVIRIDTGEYEELLIAAPEAEPPVAPDTLAGLFYTGGTTGASKGVMLTPRQPDGQRGPHPASANHVVGDDRYLTMAPMFHAAGVYCALAVIWVGAANIVQPAFSPGVTLDLIESEKITCAIAVPSMLAAMVETQATEPRNVASLRWISHGAVARRTPSPQAQL